MKAIRGFVVLQLLLAAVGLPSDAQVIGLYSDVTGTTCDISAHPGAPGHGYVIFRWNDYIAGYGYRLEGLPSGWIADSEPSGLFGDGTTAIGGTESCVPPESTSALVIGSFTITATSEERDVVLQLSPPLDPLWTIECPFYVSCSYPDLRLVCVATHPAIINATTPCVVGVESRTWTQVKRLYD